MNGGTSGGDPARGSGTGVRETGQDAAEMRELTRLAPVLPDRTERYGDHPSQLIDFHGEGDPRLVVLHGGFWREAYDRRHLAPFAGALAGHGIPVALVEYRRVGGGGGHPETFDDIAAALTRFEEPVVLAGHSAGGQLALWAASRHPERVHHTVAVAPVADLELAERLELGGGAVRDFLGEGWRELLPETDPLRLPAPAAPVTLVHGTKDAQVPLELSLNYAERHPGQLLRLPGVGHYAPFLPETPAFTTLALALRNLLAEPPERGR
nr:alpha/beta hydrolase [Streptomyces otsuchiensis]